MRTARCRDCRVIWHRTKSLAFSFYMNWDISSTLLFSVHIFAFLVLVPGSSFYILLRLYAPCFISIHTCMRGTRHQHRAPPQSDDLELSTRWSPALWLSGSREDMVQEVQVVVGGFCFTFWFSVKLDDHSLALPAPQLYWINKELWPDGNLPELGHVSSTR